MIGERRKLRPIINTKDRKLEVKAATSKSKLSGGSKHPKQDIDTRELEGGRQGG